MPHQTQPVAYFGRTMDLTLAIGSRLYRAQLHLPVSLSLPLRNGPANPNAFGMPAPAMAPVVAGGFVGSVARGGSANCDAVSFIPHCNGTHTETIGHILETQPTLVDCLTRHLFTARLLSILPEERPIGDRLITKPQLQEFAPFLAEALLVRSLPNTEEKRSMQWGNTNPPYFEAEALAYLAAQGVQHLLTDLPSVDREDDGGAMAAHKAWWGVPKSPRMQATISEMLFMPDSLPDADYLISIQPAPFALDAAPSWVVAYPLIEISEPEG